MLAMQNKLSLQLTTISHRPYFGWPKKEKSLPVQLPNFTHLVCWFRSILGLSVKSWLSYSRNLKLCRSQRGNLATREYDMENFRVISASPPLCEKTTGRFVTERERQQRFTLHCAHTHSFTVKSRHCCVRCDPLSLSFRPRSKGHTRTELGNLTIWALWTFLLFPQLSLFSL